MAFDFTRFIRAPKTGDASIDAQRQMMMAQALMGAQKPQREQTRIVPRETWAANLLPALSQAMGMRMASGAQADQKKAMTEAFASMLGGGVQQPAAPVAPPAGADPAQTPAATGNPIAAPAAPPAGAQPNAQGGYNDVLARALAGQQGGVPENIVKSFLEANKPETPAGFTLSPGQTRYGPDGKPIVAVPEKADRGTDDWQEYQRNVEQGFKGSFFDYQLALKRAGGTQINTTVNTEKSLYSGMAGKRAEGLVSAYENAQKAPELLNRAQRVKQLLGPNSQAITGAGAEQLTALAKVANQFGIDTGNSASDTELLVRELSSSTLDAIKASGLGAGSGFSNADRDFLEKAVGGKISLEGATLRRLADLNERAALKTIERWNAEASRLDPTQLRSLGMAPIEMPQGSPVPGAKPKLMKNPDGTYTYSP